MILEMFPDGYILLNKELATGLHGSLEKKLEKHPVDDVDIRLAEIASHCSVVLDGVYSLAERDHLCAVLAGRLEVLRELPKPTIVVDENGSFEVMPAPKIPSNATPIENVSEGGIILH